MKITSESVIHGIALGKKVRGETVLKSERLKGIFHRVDALPPEERCKEAFSIAFYARCVSDDEINDYSLAKALEYIDFLPMESQCRFAWKIHYDASSTDLKERALEKAQACAQSKVDALPQPLGMA